MRPRDDLGRLMPPPHVRLNEAPQLQQHALFAMAKDPRSAALSVTRKLAMIDKAIDHLVDGDAVPKWIYAKDHDRPENRFLVDLWRIAVTAVTEARKAA